jgi:hypothetical protein
MPKRETSKGGSVGKTDEAKAARERELQNLIEQVEKKKSRSTPGPGESSHDFVERQMRDKPRK